MNTDMFDDAHWRHPSARIGGPGWDAAGPEAWDKTLWDVIPMD